MTQLLRHAKQVQTRLNKGSFTHRFSRLLEFRFKMSSLSSPRLNVVLQNVVLENVVYQLESCGVLDQNLQKVAHQFF